MKKNLEIERKFLILSPPADSLSYDSHDISQGYLINKDDNEIRIRRIDSKYYLTIKSGRGKIRQEIEIRITASQFNSLWPITTGKRILKKRYIIPYGGVDIELDVFHGRHRGLMMAEVEFKNENESRIFNIPAWFGKEVTHDPRFRNANLATRKRFA